jgi:hypothetical protein
MKRTIATILLLAAALLLAVPAVSATAGPVGSSFPIHAAGEQEVQPAVVYNSQWQEYLVVFWNDRPGCDDIRAERVSRQGTLLGGAWIAAGCPAENRHPDVAYNNKANEYLVVWEEESAGNSLIRSQRFAADLAPRPEGVQTLFADNLGVGVASRPAVGYAHTADKYLVVWDFHVIPAGVTHILGRVVFADGQPDPLLEFPVSEDPGGQHRKDPDLTYNRHGDGYLVVWQQFDPVSSLWDIRGRLVNGSGATPFGPFLIDKSTVNCTAPAAAAIPTTAIAEKYLVVWERERAPGDRDIEGRWIEEDGTPANHFLSFSYVGADESGPAIAGNENNDHYLIVWRQALGVVDVPLAVVHLSWTGNTFETARFSGRAADCPAVAAGPSGDFLVAWQDQPLGATDTNIYGQVWGNRVYLPLLLR